MKTEFRTLRKEQLGRRLQALLAMKNAPRPHRGWIRAIREAAGMTGREMARRLGRAPSLVNALEKSEAEYRISLGSLRAAAKVLDCELVYAFVPQNGTADDLWERHARALASENVRAVEHSMALEDQAVGGVEEKIKREIDRILKRRARK
jgi:predicted DNA-binding mobile mystery protein A